MSKTVEFNRANIIRELERASLWKRRKRRSDGVYNAGFEIEAAGTDFLLWWIPTERSVETPDIMLPRYREVLWRFGWRSQREGDVLRVFAPVLGDREYGQ